MRIVFFGTPEFAVVSLRRIVAGDRHPVTGVVTAPDKPAGRGRRLSFSPVKEHAQKLNMPLLQPERLNEPKFLAALRAWGAECFVVVAYRILPEPVFAMPPRGTINLHASLLPEYRGAAPIRWALFDGRRETGVTTFLIRKEVDTGDILLSRAVPIGPKETHGELEPRLAETGAELLVDTLNRWADGRIQPTRQSATEVTPAPKITAGHRIVDWSQAAQTIFNRVRGLSPEPGAMAQLRGTPVKILQSKIEDPAAAGARPPGTTLEADPHTGIVVATGDGALRLTTIQPAGKRPMTAAEFVRGHRIQPGELWS